ncbi:MAG: carbohydrate binding family 9 domain-containing protein [Rhodothermia bacterium]|nr:carbohydrate binding family 9 domain-containing protein [Rhodothermia bacterium]
MKRIFLFFLVTSLQNLWAQNTQSVISAHFTEEKITVDGQLKESIWQTIVPETDFRQRQPAEGQPGTEKSELRIAYDRDNLYFGLVFYDKEPHLIRANVFDRGGRIDKDDNIQIGLDTYFDGRNGYIFEMNPLGTQDDALISDEKTYNWDWNGVYYSEGRITDFGWVLEVKIPFKTIRFSKDDELVMGVAVQRVINRKNERLTFPFIPLNYKSELLSVSRYAKLVGIKNVHRGRNLQIKPYAIAGAQRNLQTGNTFKNEFVRNAGLDLKYGLSSNLTLDLTYNTDFAQVEADAAQINLTRFNLFLPEKREFFLERNGLFEFGNAGETEAFFSRNIGITNDILAGARITGQQGKLSVGLLNIQTKDNDAQNGQNYGVVRLRADVSPRVSVGTIVTNVQNEERYNRVAGADANWRFIGASELSGWFNTVWDSQKNQNTSAGNITLNYLKDLYSAKLQYTIVDAGYNPGLGFVERDNVRRYATTLAYNPYISRTGEKKVRRLSFTTAGEYLTNQVGVLESSEIAASGTVLFVKRDRIGLKVTRAYENLIAPFAIRPNATIPVGPYTFYFASLTASSDQSRPFYLTATAQTGDFYHGTRTLLQNLIGYRFSKHLKAEQTISYNIIDLPIANGRFDATTYGLALQAATSRKLFANALIQYDNFSHRFRSNIRINWIHRPGSDLFLVFNTGYFFEDRLQFREEALLNRMGVAKLTYLIQL